MSDEDDDSSPEERLLKRHRKERKDLQGKIQNLKKSTSKGDKKRKKEVAEECAKLEHEMDLRHARELEELLQSSKKKPKKELVEDSVVVKAMNDVSIVSENSQQQPPRISKAQKRREKKDQKLRERLAEIERQEEENKNGVRNLEITRIKAILSERGLTLHDVPSDGDCLFAGIAHQSSISIGELRRKTAEYLREHADDVLPFLTNPATGDPLNPEQFEKYCSDIESTSAWGGEVELRALSHVLERAIEVIQAEGPSILVGEEFREKNPPIFLTYHRHMYGLGEHYNSTKPV